MSYPRHPLSSLGPGSRTASPQSALTQIGLLPDDPDLEALMATLARTVAHGSLEPDAIYAAIAEAAQALTGATGAALAVRCEGEFICRARSGATAPGLDARLSVASGISGECLRTGSVLLCNDTRNDYRVDPEVCQHLGLRSIAVVPVRARQGPGGILEVFSTRPHAFTGEHTSYLARLANMVEAVPQPKPDPAKPLLPAARTDENSISKRLRKLRESLGVRASG
jgi:GAF domain-containing protein